MCLASGIYGRLYALAWACEGNSVAIVYCPFFRRITRHSCSLWAIVNSHSNEQWCYTINFCIQNSILFVLHELHCNTLWYLPQCLVSPHLFGQLVAEALDIACVMDESRRIKSVLGCEPVELHGKWNKKTDALKVNRNIYIYLHLHFRKIMFSLYLSWVCFCFVGAFGCAKITDTSMGIILKCILCMGFWYLRLPRKGVLCRWTAASVGEQAGNSLVRGLGGQQKKSHPLSTNPGQAKAPKFLRHGKYPRQQNYFKTIKTCLWFGAKINMSHFVTGHPALRARMAKTMGS